MYKYFQLEGLEWLSEGGASHVRRIGLEWIKDNLSKFHVLNPHQQSV